MSLGSTAYQLLQSKAWLASTPTLTFKNIPSYKYLLLEFYGFPSKNTQYFLRFNNDSGANYSDRQSVNGAVDTTTISAAQINFSILSTTPQFIKVYIVNIPDQEKLVIAHSGGQNARGSATAPARQESVGKWANTTVLINEIDITMSTGGLGIATLWGSN